MIIMDHSVASLTLMEKAAHYSSDSTRETRNTSPSDSFRYQVHKSLAPTLSTSINESESAMSISQVKVELLKVTNNQKSIVAAASTVSLSFSRDPLIQWLRPNGRAWEHLDAQTCKWQRRRIQRALCQGIVLQSASVQDIRSKMALLSNNKPPQPESSAVNVDTFDIANTEREKQPPGLSDSGAVVILFPPKKYTKWSFSRLMLACKVWLLDRIDPAIDEGTDLSRLEKLMGAHDSGLDMIRRRYSRSEVWYLEVIAIHPLLQSCGLGKMVMQEILQYAKGQCIALECTNERNISFYERLGFSVEQEVELSSARKSPFDDCDVLKYWLMVKDDGVQRK